MGVAAPGGVTPTGAPRVAGRGSALWALAAIVLWGTLAAAVGDALEGVPAPTLVLWCLLFAAPVLAAWDLLAMRRPLTHVTRAPPRVVALGVWGIFGYHVLLFEALDRAPIVQANLVNYLWPLFIVLLAPVLARERVSPLVVLGALAGFGGAALAVTQGRRPVFSPADLSGYALALGAALAWASFSLLLKRAGTAAQGRMALFTLWSLAAAVAYAAARGGLAVPAPRALAAAAWVGAGPMALAFVCWDRAMSSGRASTIGAISYLDPLLSTLCVAWALSKPLPAATWIGMAAIIGGAAGAPLLAGLRRGPGC